MSENCLVIPIRTEWLDLILEDRSASYRRRLLGELKCGHLVNSVLIWD